MVGGSISGVDWVGDLVGFSGGVVEQSYATGNVTGVDAVGGLEGGEGGIISSFATGNVTGRDQVGGLSGENLSLIINSYSTGDVHGGVNPLNDEGYAGGLVGLNNRDIEDSYATGTVGGGVVNGGLVGANDPNPNDPPTVVSDSYWDTQTSGLSSSAGGAGRTTAQLESGLPKGFSHSQWKIAAGQSLPYLFWQAPGTGSRPAATNASNDAIARATQAAAGQIATSEDAFVGSHDRRLGVGENL
jgi:hypothetical protein